MSKKVEVKIKKRPKLPRVYPPPGDKGLKLTQQQNEA
jgi:hypothetical protein